MELNPYPITSTYQEKLDWIEISCLKDHFYIYRIADLRNTLEDTEGFHCSDIGLEDSLIENELQQLITAFEKRNKYLNESYPFKMDEDGTSFELNKQFDELNPDQHVYLYCLFFSHVSAKKVLRDKFEINHPQDRDLLQIASTIAMAGFLNGNSISFGFPRPVHDNFYDALNRSLTALNEGSIKPFDNLNSQLQSGTLKDGGVDIIAWKNNNDDYPGGRHIYFAQVASGQNWKEKPVRQDIEHIKTFWLHTPITSLVKDAICIPYDIEGDEQGIKDSMEIWGNKLGDIFHRIRLPYEFKKGINLSLEDPTLMIERTEEVNKIQNFVISFVDSLKQK